MSFNSKILIVGATGRNGRELLSQFNENNIHVRAMVRNIEKTKKLKNATTELIEGDLSDPESLKVAFIDIDIAYIVTPVHPDSVIWFSNFFNAAKNANVKHVIKFSGFGADINSDSEVLRQHGESDKQLMESGLTYTILRPNSFYQNILWLSTQIKARGKFCMPLADASQSFIDMRDVAEATFNICTSDTHKNKIYKLTGPESLSLNSMANKLSSATGRLIKYMPITIKASEAGMKAAGLPEWNARVLAEIQGIFATGAYSKTTDDMKILLGREPRTFTDFAADYANHF